MKNLNSNFDIAQICRNGHKINSSSQDYPQFNQDFCEECGSPTITACPECASPIQGAGRNSMFDHFTVPKFCAKCGSPYPWTKAKLQAALDLTKEVENLDNDEKVMLEKSIDDLVKDTPDKVVAAIRFKKLMVKVGQGASSAFREILVDVVSESAKKLLWP